MSRIVFLICSFMIAVNVLGKTTLAVLPFKVGNSLQINVGNLNITPQILEREFSNQLLTFLVKSRKFKVVDREDIRKVIDEYKLTESEWAQPGQMQKIGKLLVADYLVVGNIDRVSFLFKPIDIKITGQKSVNIIATFKLSFRVIDVKTGQVVFAESLIEKTKSRDIKREISPDVWRDWTIQDYKDLLFKRTATKAGNAILLGIFPVKIAAINGNQVILNRGKGAGISVGQKYNVFNQGESVKDPDTGEILGSQETKVGTIEITAIEPKFSKGTILTGVDAIKIKAICRAISVEREDPEPAYPKANTPKW